MTDDPFGTGSDIFPPKMPQSFTAQLDSRCECGEQIHEGDALYPTEDGQWVGGCCND